MANGSNGFLDSSDSVRGAGPLKYAQTVTFEEPLELERGGVLPQTTVAYETYGRLNAAARQRRADLPRHQRRLARRPARRAGRSRLVGHGRWSARASRSTPTGYFVICPNILGGCRGTTGPGSINPATGRPYGARLPHRSPSATWWSVQKRLVDHLGIAQPAGGGRRLDGRPSGARLGHRAIPTRSPGRSPLATSPRLTSQALAFDVVGRNAILRDPNFRGGQYYDQDGTRPAVGLAIARMIGHITYLSPEAMSEKFDADRLQPRDVATEFEKKFSVGSYLGYQGSKFVERFDANSYITLSMAMDLFDLGAQPRATGRGAGAQPRAAGWSSASPATGCSRRANREDIVAALLASGQAGQLLQRHQRLRARRLPAARRPGPLRRADPRVPGQPGRRRPCGAPTRTTRGPTADQHLPAPAAGLRPHRRADPAAHERAGPRLRRTGQLLTMLRAARARAAGGRGAGRAGRPRLRAARAGRDPRRPEQGPGDLRRPAVRLRGAVADPPGRARRGGRRRRHAARGPAVHRQLPQLRLPQAAEDARRGGPGARIPGPAALQVVQHAQHPLLLHRRLPGVLRASAASPSTARSPWTPRPGRHFAARGAEPPR